MESPPLREETGSVEFSPPPPFLGGLAESGFAALSSGDQRRRMVASLFRGHRRRRVVAALSLCIIFFVITARLFSASLSCFLFGKVIFLTWLNDLEVSL